jgi:hypothetical protein
LSQSAYILPAESGTLGPIASFDCGTWRVVAYETHITDGTVIKEFGDNPPGYFIYDGTGHLAIQVMENPAKKDPPVSFAYFGTYRVDAAKGIVVHHA